MKGCAIRIVVRPRTMVSLVAIGVLTSSSTRAAPRGAPSPHELQCEYGITLALDGETSRAESVFVSLLSHAPGDARAMNNLGNLALLDGNAAAALSFYRVAAKSDTADPGIVLNEATALLLLGQEDAAISSAAEGVKRAGGLEHAAEYLGLFYNDETAEAARGEKKSMSKEEALLLLQAAAGKVPSDSTNAKARPEKRPNSPPWRSAGPRAEDQSEVPAVVYWKR